MTACNAVRFSVKPGMEREFVEAHEKATLKVAGLRKACLIKTGERKYCFVGEWDDMESLAGARSAMVAILDSFRHTLEDLGGGLGMTDPVSGPAVWETRS